MNVYVVAIVASTLVLFVIWWYIPAWRNLYVGRHPERRQSRWFCHRCGQILLVDVQERNGRRYCGARCQQASDPMAFCRSCLDETEPAPEGLRLEKVNFTGTGMQVMPYGTCSQCSSRVCSIGFEVLGTPVGTVEYYRFICVTPAGIRGPMIFRRMKA